MAKTAGGPDAGASSKHSLRPTLALAGFDDIFNVGGSPQWGESPQSGECVTEVFLTELHAPDCHPFQVNNDDAMNLLV
jgi:hypothetical protein